MVWYVGGMRASRLNIRIKSFIVTNSQQRRDSFLGILILSFGFLPGVFRTSFWSDDYSALSEVNATSMHALRDARPIYALVLKFSYSFIMHSPGDGWRLRFMGFIGLLSLYLYAVKKLPNGSNRRLLGIGIATAFCTSPFQMQVHWAIAWILPWTSLLAWIAFDISKSTFRFKRVLSILLMSIALLTYPLTAVFFISALSVTAIINRDSNRYLLALLRDGFILVFSAIAVSVVGTFFVFKLFGIEANQRVGLVALSDLPRKVIWFLTRPFVIGLRPFQISSPSSVQALLNILPVVLLIFLGILISQGFKVGTSLIRFMVVIVSIGSSMFPLLVTSPNEFEFRMISGYEWSVVVLLFYFLLILAEFCGKIVFRRIRLDVGRLLKIGLICMSLVGIITLNQNYNKFINGPYSTKTAFLLRSIRACTNEQFATGITLLPPTSPFPSMNNLGLYSMTTDLQSEWVPKANVEILLKTQGIRAKVFYAPERTNRTLMPKNMCVIDLEKYRQEIL